MIKNERQYRITRSQLAKFQLELGLLEESADILAPIHRGAHQSMVEQLEEQVAEYEALREGKVTVLSIASLGELPLSLIKARIARNMTHRQLAEQIGVKEQQIQRWESEDYEGASLEALMSIASALGVETATSLFLSFQPETMKKVMTKLGAIGIGKRLLAKILSPPSLAAMNGETKSSQSIMRALHEVSNVIGLSLRNMLGPSPLSQLSCASARFKTIAAASGPEVHAFAVYAHYVAALAVQAVEENAEEPLPQSWQGMRTLVLKNFGKITFESVLKQAWKCGVIVIPVHSSGAFHGAVWQINGRFVVVLKQTNRQSARWLFDLLHELAHASKGHVSEDHAIVETEPIGPKESDTDDEETVANEWAEDVLFDGKSNDIEAACLAACKGNLRKLKAVLPEVARDYSMEVGVLANHMAWRLGESGHNWWGAAGNLQQEDNDPFEEVRSMLCSKLRLKELNSFDRDLLIRAISNE